MLAKLWAAFARKMPPEPPAPVQPTESAPADSRPRPTMPEDYERLFRRNLIGVWASEGAGPSYGPTDRQIAFYEDGTGWIGILMGAWNFEWREMEEGVLGVRLPGRPWRRLAWWFGVEKEAPALFLDWADWDDTEADTAELDDEEGAWMSEMTPDALAFDSFPSRP